MLTRRQFSQKLLGTSAALLASEDLWPSSKLASPSRQHPEQDCDLLIKDGLVIDPAANVHATLDVAIKDSKIVRLSPNIPPGSASKVVSAKGKLVCPGLIDVHVHVYDGVCLYGVNADKYCVSHGVTTAIDAGSAGYPSITGFRKYIIQNSITRIMALLDIGALGTLVSVKDSLKNLEWVNPQLVAKAAEENKSAVVGIKARLSKEIAGPNDLEVLGRTLQAAEACNLPIMLHVGDTYSPLRLILNKMRKGDVLTHCYTPRPHGILNESGKVLSEVREARQRGVLFDIGHGTGHFGFDVAAKCMEQDFLPDTISSDLALQSVNGPTFDLPTTLSKFLLLGVNIDKIIESVTVSPTHMFGFGQQLGTLQVGTPADIAILELRDERFEFSDCIGEKRTGRQRILSSTTIREGKIFDHV